MAHKKSFFPDCISIWNKLPNSAINAVNLVSFKKNQSTFKNWKPSWKFYPYHDGFFGKILTQIKLKLSLLNAQLFEYNLTENPFCAACGNSVETPLHFFTECTSYEPYRQILFRYLLFLNSKIINPEWLFKLVILTGSNFGNRDNASEKIKQFFATCQCLCTRLNASFTPNK